MTVNFADRIRVRRRLEILLLLAASPRYGAHVSTLVLGVADRGVAASHDAVNADIAWLDEQGLLQVQGANGSSFACATQRGLDVARGLATVPGVARPGPDDL